MRRGAIALWALAATAACAGKRISDIDAPPSQAPGTTAPWRVPPGVAVPATRRDATAEGLFPALDPAERCCWIAPQATVGITRLAGATALALDVFVPDYPFFAATPPTLEVALATRRERFGPLGRGVHRLRLPLAGLAFARTPLRVRLDVDRAFVPAREHVNADTRTLGIILLRIALERDEPSPP